MSRPKIKRFPLYAHPGLHVRVIVWATRSELIDYSGRNDCGWNRDQRAFFRFGTQRAGSRVLEKHRVGDLHLSQAEWDTELVFHECLHAAFFLQSVTLGALKCEDIPVALEEPLCYSIGQLGDQVHKWLWEIAPSKKWSKTE